MLTKKSSSHKIGTMHLNCSNANHGFTMVEMLAVVAVIAIIVALVVPNGIYSKAAGEDVQARANGAMIEMAMSSYASLYGSQARTTWHATTESDRLNLLISAGSFPPNITRSQLNNDLAGYAVTLPDALNERIQIVSGRSGLTIYPN